METLKNNTLFYAPLWIDNYAKFVSALKNDDRYTPINSLETGTDKYEEPEYLLPYIMRIYRDKNLFSEFELRKEYFPDLCMYESIFASGGSVKLQRIRVVCFSTGCAFVEFQVGYAGASLEQIADFSYNFKNAGKNEDRRAPNPTKKTKMKDAIADLMPESAGVTTFFASSGIKNECKMFHQIFAEETVANNETTESDLNKYLVLLRRGYHNGFAIPNIGEEYDMVFEPYEYDHWSGSQEGLVNIYQLSDNGTTNKYLTTYKPKQLATNYRFMYLILLNQRFSAINYLGMIPLIRSYKRRQRERLNEMTSMLKTVFSFSIVSDDQLYQTIYSKMYTIMGIDRLLSDIRDNEEQIEILQNHDMLDAEKRTSSFLFGLSILSLFSVLVDAAGYFDRFSPLKSLSTTLSIVCLGAIVVCYLIWWIHDKMK